MNGTIEARPEPRQSFLSMEKYLLSLLEAIGWGLGKGSGEGESGVVSIEVPLVVALADVTGRPVFVLAGID